MPCTILGTWESISAQNIKKSPPCLQTADILVGEVGSKGGKSVNYTHIAHQKIDRYYGEEEINEEK